MIITLDIIEKNTKLRQTAGTYSPLKKKRNFQSTVLYKVQWDGCTCLSFSNSFRPEPENISRNPKTNLKPKPPPPQKKDESQVRYEKFSNVAKIFWLYFVHLRQKSRLRPKLSPKFLSALGPNPTQKARPDLQFCVG